MKRTILLASVLTTALVTTSGCASFRQAIGVDKQPPDEYTVVENAPLTMPPDFGLRPPATISGKPAEAPVQDQAENTVFTAGEQSNAGSNSADLGNGFSPGEAALLGQAGATNADPAIREQVGQDPRAKQDNGIVDRILFWHKKMPAEETLDAQKESDRIQSNAETGKPINAGSVPVIQRTNRTIFDAL